MKGRDATLLYTHRQTGTGGALKPAFGLSGPVRQPVRGGVRLACDFLVDHSGLISTRPAKLVRTVRELNSTAGLGFRRPYGTRGFDGAITRQ